jgi:DNA gyrase/topoisomerase IV subunit A
MARLERKFSHELDLKEARLEIVMGFLKAIDKIDAVIKIIRGSANTKEALTALVTTKTLKFTPDQARAILEMRLRQLTGLDRQELETESEELRMSIGMLSVLIKDESKRSEWLVKQVNDLAKRHGNARVSQLIDPPDSLAVVKAASGEKPVRVAKPRFLKIDLKKGTVEQAKGPRGATVLDPKDKLIAMTEDGMLKKLPSNYKGPISSSFSPVVLAKREAEVTERTFLAVFKLGETLKAVSLSGADLCKVTSKGKAWLPEGAECVFFGEGSWPVPWTSKRKKALTLTAKEVKSGKPGAQGVKIAQLTEVSL